jgi:hypothetical protein
MNIEDLIRNNKEKFESELPANHQNRFAMKMHSQIRRKNNMRRLWFGVTSAVAAVMLLFLIMNNQEMIKPHLYQENDKVVEMRNIYEQQVDEAVMLLENVLDNVDDSTKMEINKVIENLTSTADVFAEIAPLPEEKQLAITSQIYDSQLESLNIIYRKIKSKEE